MKDKYWTILVVGYDGKRIKSFRIRKSLFKAFLLFTVGIFSYIAVASFGIYKLDQKVASLEKERDMLTEELKTVMRENARLFAITEKVRNIEENLLKIDSFLRKRGIRKVKYAVGGSSPYGDDDIFKYLDINYLTFLEGRSAKLIKMLRNIPLGYPVYGRITSRYGYRIDPFTGKYEFHKGVDIRARYGAPVRATADGIVEFAGRHPGYGKMVIIRHKYGFKTLYAHLSKIKTRAGRRVKVGTVIGYVGSTGKSTGPHLHYEVRRYKRTKNPVHYLVMR